MKYVVVYEKSATGWDAYVPDLPAVIATSATKKETRRLIREAIELHLDALRKITYRFRSRAHQQK